MALSLYERSLQSWTGAEKGLDPGAKALQVEKVEGGLGI
jgi:hypothetical protein